MAVFATIAVTNNSSVLEDIEVQMACADLQHQAIYHFGPFWHAAARLLFFPKGTPVPAGAWHLSYLDDSDMAGALGYHDVTPSNQPLLKVFAKTDKDNGLSPWVTASHEVLETLADPWVSAGWQVDANKWYALEVCDPVEADVLAYKGPHGTLLSDFVLPAWYVPGLQVAKYSYRGSVHAPLQLAEGGFASVYIAGKGWTQVNKFKGEERTAHSLRTLRTPASTARAKQRAEVGKPITCAPADEPA